MSEKLHPEEEALVIRGATRLVTELRADAALQQVASALAEIPESVWSLAEKAEALRLALRHENSGMMAGSGIAAHATGKARSDFEAALHSGRLLDRATALCVLRGIRAVLRVAEGSERP